MRILTVTNLYPRPDQPQRGLFNAQQFRAMAEALTARSRLAPGTDSMTNDQCPMTNICLVPEWRWWRWNGVRRWLDPFEGRLRTRYVPAFYLPRVGRSLSWRTFAAALETARRDLEESDVVLASWLYPDAVAAAVLARQCRKRLWIKVHGSDRLHLFHRARRRRILDACAQAEGLICNCRFIADQLAARGVADAKLHIVRNGVDTSKFRFRNREAARQELSARLAASAQRAEHSQVSGFRFQADARLVLFIGNLVSVKRPEVLLEAWRRVRAQASGEIRLAILGEGPLRGQLERTAQAWGLRDAIEFAGSRPHDEIPLWMNAADALCLTSRSEGMPNVILEALASGLPVAATDVGACRELLAGEPAARVVKERCQVSGAGLATAERLVEAGGQATAGREPKAGELEPETDLAGRIAEALRDLLESPVDREQMAKRHAGSLSWQQSASEILRLLDTGGAQMEGR